MDNEQNQSDVAYESAPKELNVKRGMPKSKQFGKHKMPQDSKSALHEKASSKEVMANHPSSMHTRHGRHKEHR